MGVEREKQRAELERQRTEVGRGGGSEFCSFGGWMVMGAGEMKELKRGSRVGWKGWWITYA